MTYGTTPLSNAGTVAELVLVSQDLDSTTITLPDPPLSGREPVLKLTLEKRSQESQVEMLKTTMAPRNREELAEKNRPKTDGFLASHIVIAI